MIGTWLKTQFGKWGRAGENLTHITKDIDKSSIVLQKRGGGA